jgi:hypothetical protein
MEDDLWDRGRERAREQVREVFAGTAAPAERTCRFCGARAHTRFERCEVCGRSYFERPPRLGRTARLATAALALAALAVLLSLLIPRVGEQRRVTATAAREESARIRAAAVARIAREQRPHRAAAAELRPPASAGSGDHLRARRALVARLEASVTADARARQASGQLTGSPARLTVCGPLVRNQRVGDEEDLAKAIGRYSCIAASRDVVQDGRRVGLFGTPFVAAVDFRRFSYVWCKDNPGAAPGDTSQLVQVRLPRECLAARGRAFGTGYVEP